MLKVLQIEQSNEWDAIVKSFKDYDVYYLSGYVKAFQKHGDGDPLLFYYQSNNTRGINVVMKRDIAKDTRFLGKIKNNRYFDFITPYGYGGWIIEGKETKELFREYNQWCIEHGIISEFVRFHPVLKNHLFSQEYYRVISLGETVTVDTTSKELIWNNFNPKNRNVIRKAINNGIQIKQSLSKELLDAFRVIYNRTMDKDNANEYYYFDEAFYNCILRDLKDNALVFYAELNGIIIAASIIIFANGKSNYHLSGSIREYQNLAPSNLLLWKAAEWSNENGCKTFHLGGGVGSKEDSLFRFKKAFYRGEYTKYYVGQKVFVDSVYKELLAINGTESSDNFFPKYRG